jgi:N4-gp56 family major capsid protein
MATDFATNETNTTTYNDVSYSAIITDQVLDALMAAVVTPPMMDFYDLSGQASLAVDIPKAQSLSAAALTEGTEVLNTALSSDKVTITAAEIGVQITVTDVLELSDIPAAHGARLRTLGRSLADKLDVDITALYASFSNVVGSTTVDLALANLLDAIYNLEVNNATANGPFVGVLHPRQIADLRNAIDAESGVAYSDVAGPRANVIGPGGGPGFFGSWYGIPFWQSTNVPTANAAADRAGAVFVSNYALGLAQKWAAKVEVMRWPPIRGFVVTAHMNYGVGEIQDLAGVSVITDA